MSIKKISLKSLVRPVSAYSRDYRRIDGYRLADEKSLKGLISGIKARFGFNKDIGREELEKDIRYLYPSYQREMKVTRTNQGSLAVTLFKKPISLAGVLIYQGGYALSTGLFTNPTEQTAFVNNTPYHKDRSNEDIARHPVTVKPGQSRKLLPGSEIRIGKEIFVYLPVVKK